MKNRMIEFDTTKVFLIVLVVFAHVTRMYTPSGVVKISVQSNLLIGITNFIYLFHMPAFIAVSGAVFYHIKRERKKHPYNKAFIMNKTRKLLIPYFFFTLFYVLPTLLVIGELRSLFGFIVRNVFFLGGPNHLWYAVMIFNVFIIFGFLENKIHSFSPILNFSILLLVGYLSFLIPNLFQARNTAYYILYFYLGYVYQQHRDKVNLVANKSLVMFSSLFILLIMFVSLYHIEIDFGYTVNWFLRVIAATSGTVFLYSFSVFASEVFLIKNSIVETINLDLFGIYLFHPMIIYLLFYSIRDIQHNPYLVTVLFTMISFLLSMVFVRLFRILKINILIGESPNQVRIKANAL
ncbi:acyltransferase family protein [Alkalibacterium sp. f15]|uniref:acyltransferase family protein n=1 Tax=Alkalibacterium sp. f15 TaxID=3414029 RepID=UPI003BF7BA59